MEDKKINRPKSPKDVVMDVSTKSVYEKSTTPKVATPSQKVNKRIISKKLMFILPIFFVIAIVSSLAVVFGVKRQEQIKPIEITTYDYLPLEIEDGEIKSYNGKNDGSVVLEIPSKYIVAEDGTLLPYSEEVLQNDEQNLEFIEITSIAKDAFKDVKFFCLTIDMENIAQVGESAFENAENIYLENNQNGYVIGDCAFKNSTMALENNTMYAKPNGSKASIGTDAFTGSKYFDISQVNFDSNTISLKAATTTTQNNGVTLIASETSGIIKLNASSVSGVSNINFTDFYGTVYFADEMARNNATVTTITLPKGISYIGNRAFHTCSNLTSVTTQGDIQKLDIAAFANCTSLSSINLRFTSLKKISDSVFFGCSSLTSVKLPTQITKIEQYAFYNTSISTISLPSKLTTIEQYAFNNCYSLTDITLPINLNSIGAEAFSGCPLLNITLPSSLTSLDKTAFGTQNMEYVVANSSCVYDEISSGVPFVTDTYKILQSVDNGSNSYLSSGFTKVTEGNYNVYTSKGNYVYFDNNDLNIDDIQYASYNLLPQGYTGVEYIATTGTQYIDTNILSSYNLTIDATIAVTEEHPGSTYRFLFGNSAGWIMNFVEDSTGVRWVGYETKMFITTYSVNQILNIKSSQDYCYINGIGIPESPDTNSAISLGNFYIGTGFVGSYFVGQMKVYKFKIFDSGVLVRDYIPCSNSNGILGLWDTVSSQFFTNSGSGTFLSGSNIQANSISVGSTYGDLPTPTRSGYTFAGWNLLPQGYTGVEYIEANRYQYINTGINQKNKSTVDCKFYTSSPTRNYLFGDLQNSGSMMYNGLYYNDSLEYNWQAIYFTASNTIEMKQQISGNNTVMNINGQIFTVETGTTATDNTIYIFACNHGSRTFGMLRCYYFKMYENNVLVRNFIPCMNQNGKYGLWDSVSNQFFGNSGTGSLSGGPVINTTITSADFVSIPNTHKLYAHWGNNSITLNANGGSISLPKNYKAVSYLGFSGTQYINTGITSLTAPFSIEIKYNKTNTVTSDQCLFGARRIGKYPNIYRNYYELDPITDTRTAADSAPNNEIVTVLSDSATGFYRNGELLLAYSAGNQSGTQPALIGAFTEESTFAPTWLYSGYIYSIKIVNAGVIYRNFVPCIRLTDNKPGMFDTITQTFYKNDGTGEFTYGTSTTLSQISHSIVTNNDYGYIETPTRSGYSFIGWSLLPSEYQQVEYIEGFGSQYIDTGYSIKSEIQKVEMKASFPRSPSNLSLFGAYGDGNNLRFSMTPYSHSDYGYGSGYTFRLWAGTTGHIFSGGQITLSKTDASVLTFVANNGDISVNLNGGTYNSTYSGSLINSANIFIFGKNNQNIGTNENGLGYRLYYMKIWDNGKLVRNFIPCLKISDSKPGLWDTVTQTFYINQGSDDFSYGSFVNELINPKDTVKIENNHTLYARWIPNSGTNSQYGYKVVDYIESTGLEYIDTGINPSEKSIIWEVDGAFISVPEVGLMGAFGGDDQRFHLGMYSNESVGFHPGIGSNYLWYGATSDYNRHLLSLDYSGIFKMDGTTIWTVTPDGSLPNLNIWLFNENYLGSLISTYACSFRLYNSKIYDNGTLVRNFRPCWSEEHQAYGLYDTVSNTFYENKGTGAFVGGPELYEY